MSQKANCPACGGPVTFAVGTSLVTVCPYCRSVVARGDKGLEDLGKVADVVQSESPLDVGVKGRYEGAPFTLTGRTQYSHPAGGVWDEWYAAFGDGRWGWLAEAQGRFYVTFEAPPQPLPAYDDLRLGQAIEINNHKLTVAEKNKGAVAGATGELPFRLAPGKPHPFADLSGPRGEFATIDYSGDRPVVYLGREATLDELQIPPGKRREFPGQGPKIQALQLNCPQCGAALALRAPDKTLRVGCPSCGALLDVSEGKLKLLQSLEPPKVTPVLELGSVGKWQGAEWTVIGFMQRFVTFEGTDYFWEEYLLYQPRLGFRWLTRDSGHWNWVESVPPASVRIEGNVATHGGTSYRLFQSALAKVSFVVGEFYWKVQADEAVQSRDFVRAPNSLSEEVTTSGDDGEVNWSKATYVRPEEVEAAFALKPPLPRPTSIGPNQPFPHTGIYSAAALLLGLTLLVGFVFWIISPRKEVYHNTLTLAALPDGQRSHKVLVDEPLSLASHQNVEVRMRPTGSTTWMHVEGTLTPAGPAPRPGEPTPPNNETRRFAFAAMQGETGQVFLGGVPKGDYRLQYELSWQTPTQPAGAEVRLREGVPHGGPFVFLLLAIGAVPLGLGLYQLYWESRRWAESNP